MHLKSVPKLHFHMFSQLHFLNKFWRKYTIKDSIKNIIFILIIPYMFKPVDLFMVTVHNLITFDHVFCETRPHVSGALILYRIQRR